MVLSCALCEGEFVFLSSVCCECRRIKHIMNIYSKEEVLNVLEKILVRGSEHINKSIINEIKNKD